MRKADDSWPIDKTQRWTRPTPTQNISVSEREDVAFADWDGSNESGAVVVDPDVEARPPEGTDPVAEDPGTTPVKATRVTSQFVDSKNLLRTRRVSRKGGKRKPEDGSNIGEGRPCPTTLGRTLEQSRPASDGSKTWQKDRWSLANDESADPPHPVLESTRNQSPRCAESVGNHIVGAHHKLGQKNNLLSLLPTGAGVEPPRSGD